MNETKQVDNSYVRWGFKCGHFSMVHYIKLVPGSGFFLDCDGRLQAWSGLTWETLNFLEGNHLYRTGYCQLRPKTISFMCLTANKLDHVKAAAKRFEFKRLDAEAPCVDYFELKRIIDLVFNETKQ